MQLYTAWWQICILFSVSEAFLQFLSELAHCELSPGEINYPCDPSSILITFSLPPPPPEIFSPCKPSWICPNFKEVSWVTHQFTDIKKVSRSLLSRWLKLLISSIIYKPIPVPRYESPCIISSMSFLYSIYCTNERREFVCISEWSKKKVPLVVFHIKSAGS